MASSSSLVKTVLLRVQGDAGEANRMLDEIAAKAEALKDEHPELTVSIDRAKALYDATVMKAELRSVLERDPIKVPVDVDSSKASATLRRIVGGVFGSALGGLLGGSGAGAGAGIPGIGGALGAIGPAGGLAAVGVLSASGAFGVIPALLAAITGLGAFVALAYPTVTAITGGVTATATAASNLATAQANLTAAKATYQRDPTQANLDALKTAQTALTTATQAQTAAWAALDPAQQKVVRGIQGLQSNFDTLAQKFEPFVIQVAGLAIQIGNKLLPVLGQFANAAAPAVVKLLERLNTAAGSPQFKQFVDQMVRLVPGTLAAVGNGLFLIGGALGNMLEMLSRNRGAAGVLTALAASVAYSIYALGFALEALAAPVNGILKLIGWLGNGNTAAVSGPYAGSFGGFGSTLSGGLSGLGALGGTLPALVPAGGGPGPGKLGILSAAPVNAATIAGTGGLQVNLMVQAGPGDYSEFLARQIRQYVHGRGGNVQAALGTG